MHRDIDPLYSVIYSITLLEMYWCSNSVSVTATTLTGHPGITTSASGTLREMEVRLHVYSALRDIKSQLLTIAH